VVAKIRERLAVINKQHRSLMEKKFNLRKLNEVKFRKKYHIEITNKFAAVREH